MKRITYKGLALIVLLAACGPGKKEKPQTGNPPPVAEQPYKQAPPFNPDSAYYFIEKQVSFGPRIPNTAAHARCAEWLRAEFGKYADSVHIQTAKLFTWDKKYLDAKNIQASFAPEKSRRILLTAHWDTRPFSDEDPLKPGSTFDGADDGASGVGVLLEIARILKNVPLENIGVDIVLFDAEDWGNSDIGDSYCLGSQYWARNFSGKYKPYFGINLDMVGAAGARFCREGFSTQYAAAYVNKVWNAAARSGYSSYFLMEDVPGVIDDHYYVSQLAGIPSLDIINYSRYNGSQGGFGAHWHTQKDNMQVIDKQTLQAVGTVLLDVLYNE